MVKYEVYEKPLRNLQYVIAAHLVNDQLLHPAMVDRLLQKAVVEKKPRRKKDASTQEPEGAGPTI